MNDSLITFSGNVGGPVDLSVVRDEVPVATLRVGSTPRRLRDGRWEDGETLWYTVKAWRQLASNLAESVRTGDPILVTGRMTAESWTREDGTIATRHVVVAVSVGHDLSRGRSVFSRGSRSERSAVGAGAGTAHEASGRGARAHQEPDGGTGSADADTRTAVEEPAA